MIRLTRDIRELARRDLADFAQILRSTRHEGPFSEGRRYIFLRQRRLGKAYFLLDADKKKPYCDITNKQACTV